MLSPRIANQNRDVHKFMKTMKPTFLIILIIDRFWFCTWNATFTQGISSLMMLVKYQQIVCLFVS